MKALTTLLAGLLMVASMAMAADAEKNATTTTDTSHNPVTGSTTVTKKMKKKHKDGKDEAKSTVTEKTKTMKDGSVKKSTEVDATTSTEAKH